MDENCESSGDDSDEEESENSAPEQAMPERQLKIAKNQVPPFGLMIKPSVKRNEHYVPILQVRLASRGGKKWVTQIWNYVDFPQQIPDPKECCSKIARKFAGSCGLTTMPDGTEELMALQGNFVHEVVTFFEDLGVPKDQIFVAEQ